MIIIFIISKVLYLFLQKKQKNVKRYFVFLLNLANEKTIDSTIFLVPFKTY